MPMPNASEIDLDFRPLSYFWPLGIERHLLARVKGDKRKAALKRLIDDGRIDEITQVLAVSSLSDTERRAIGRLHPSLMGGEYLPDMDAKEVEIARISIKSVTSDVTSLYARRGAGRIRYRVVDEYQGETLTGRTKRTSVQPLILGEMYRFLVGAWQFMAVLEMNYAGNLDRMLGFFTGSSVFYPQFDALLRSEVRARYSRQAER